MEKYYQQRKRRLTSCLEAMFEDFTDRVVPAKAGTWGTVRRYGS